MLLHTLLQKNKFGYMYILKYTVLKYYFQMYHKHVKDF